MLSKVGKSTSSIMSNRGLQSFFQTSFHGANSKRVTRAFNDEFVVLHLRKVCANVG